ncbi:MAG: hypothetical protein RIC56_19710 [Pseudomonadales bacterium]
MLVSVAVLLGGCVGQPPAEPADQPMAVGVTEEPLALPGEPAGQIPPEPPGAGPGVAIVLSSDTPDYLAVAEALDRRLPRPAARFSLTAEDPAALQSRLRATGYSGAIAIGRQALDLLQTTELVTVYCQVFDPSAPRDRVHGGVESLPRYGAQLESWLKLQPDLRSVGIITGPDHESAADTLEAAASRKDLKVLRAVARSDKELLFLFRRMVPDIEGYLLYPDASILSPTALTELLGYARKHDVWVATYNQALFDAGATLLIAADPDEVAEQTLRALQALDPATDPRPLSRARVTVRQTLVAQ